MITSEVLTIVVLISIAVIVAISIIRLEIQGKYLRPDNLFEILKYNGGKVQIGSNGFLSIEKVMCDFGDDLPTRAIFSFSLYDKKLESVEADLIFINGNFDNVTFVGPWSEEIERVLKEYKNKMELELKDEKLEKNKLKEHSYNEAVDFYKNHSN